MADLLECLLQIKGLRETARRIEALAQALRASPAPEAVDRLSRLAEIEAMHGVWLRLMLTTVHPPLPPELKRPRDVGSLWETDTGRHWDAATAADQFLARRRGNLELLENCSAEDLARTGEHPGRRDLTVADVVALMLASDVELFGEIRRALGQ